MSVQESVVQIHGVQPSLLVGDFNLDAKSAEIVTGNRIDVVAGVVMEP